WSAAPRSEVFALAPSAGLWRLLETPRGSTTDVALLNGDGGRDFAVAASLDLRVGQELWSADGRRLPLAGVGKVTWVHRVPAGWLYGGQVGNVRLLTIAGALVDPHIDAPTVVVSSDGTEVAWRRTAVAEPASAPPQKWAMIAAAR